MALCRYFALGSVLTRASTLNEKEPEEAKTLVHGGVWPGHFGPVDRMNIIRQIKIRQIFRLYGKSQTVPFLIAGHIFPT